MGNFVFVQVIESARHLATEAQNGVDWQGLLVATVDEDSQVTLAHFHDGDDFLLCVITGKKSGNVPMAKTLHQFNLKNNAPFNVTLQNRKTTDASPLEGPSRWGWSGKCQVRIASQQRQLCQFLD